MNLAEQMAKLPEPPNDSAPPQWDYWRHDLWQRAQQDKPENFYRWPCVYHTMLVEHWTGIVTGNELPYLSASQRPPAQAEPAEYRNLIHQAYHLSKWENATGKRIADLSSIYEFGGGYGAMALACNRLGFKGKYYIYDLPEFSLLQQWYLEHHNVDGVEWRSRITKLDVDLMIACYSLSESPMALRDNVLGKVRANNYLFLYSAQWEEWDNLAWFRGLDLGKQWRHEHIAHLPPESWYSWGW